VVEQGRRGCSRGRSGSIARPWLFGAPLAGDDGAGSGAAKLEGLALESALVARQGLAGASPIENAAWSCASRRGDVVRRADLGPVRKFRGAPERRRKGTRPMPKLRAAGAGVRPRRPARHTGVFGSATRRSGARRGRGRIVSAGPRTGQCAKTLPSAINFAHDTDGVSIGVSGSTGAG